MSLLPIYIQFILFNQNTHIHLIEISYDHYFQNFPPLLSLCFFPKVIMMIDQISPSQPSSLIPNEITASSSFQFISEVQIPRENCDLFG